MPLHCRTCDKVISPVHSHWVRVGEEWQPSCFRCFEDAEDTPARGLDTQGPPAFVDLAHHDALRRTWWAGAIFGGVMVFLVGIVFLGCAGVLRAPKVERHWPQQLQ